MRRSYIATKMIVPLLWALYIAILQEILRMKQLKQIAAIIAGNAPSIKEIDYARMPRDFRVFRCNQFYFEDKYYLGKKVEATTFATQMFFEQIYTMLVLNQKCEYQVDSIFLFNNEMHLKCAKRQNMQYFMDFISGDCLVHKIFDCKYSPNIAEFLEHLKLQELYFDKHPTSGIMLCAIAIAMGYRDIYLCGIDFYENKPYAFSMSNKNVLSIMPEFASIGDKIQKQENQWHTKEADLEALSFLQRHYGARFYSLCPNSPLSRYFPLAPITNSDFVVEKKSEGYINDVLIPDKNAYSMLNALRGGVKCRLKDNLYFKIFYDLLKLRKDIKQYLQYKRGEL